MTEKNSEVKSKLRKSDEKQRTIRTFRSAHTKKKRQEGKRECRIPNQRKDETAPFWNIQEKTSDEKKHPEAFSTPITF